MTAPLHDESRTAPQSDEAPGVRVSCLVVSRTASLLNRLSVSLASARAHWIGTDELLCSWNGSAEEEQRLRQDGLPRLRVTQREPYHFARNMNALARQATGDVLALLNDDLILDPGALDRGLSCLLSKPEVALVGGRLRYSNGKLAHAGILFAADGTPYNRLRPDRLGYVLEDEKTQGTDSGPIPAVTGAIMLIRRQHLLELPFRETFDVCGEDVALCLDLLEKCGLSTYYAADMSGVHDEKTTRGSTNDTHDLAKVALVAQSAPHLAQTQHPWICNEADELELLLHRQHLLRLEVEHKLDVLNKRYQELEHQYQELERKNQDLSQRFEWQVDQNENLTWELSQTRLRVQQLEDSLSWKVTRPVRYVGDLLARARSSD